MKLKLKSSIQLKRIAAKNKKSLEDYDYAKEDPTTGLFIVKENGKYGLVNEDGVEIVKPIYDDIDYFSDGMARIKIRKDYLENYYGFINVKGEVVIEPKFAYAWDFFNGLAKVAHGDYWNRYLGFIDKKGNYVVETRYSVLTRTRQGFKGRRQGLWIKIDKNGKENLPSIIQNKKFKVLTESIYCVESNIRKGNSSLVDIKENVVLFDGLDDAGRLNDQKGIKNIKLFEVYKDDLCGVFDAEQKKLIVPIKYKDVGKINDIFYLCRLDSKLVIFNSKEKKEIIAPFRDQYSYLYFFLDRILESPVGWSTLDDERNLKFYDSNFNLTKSWDKDYDEVKFISYFYYYTEHYIHDWHGSQGLKYFYVKKDGKGGLYVTDMNDRGKQITPLIFDFDESVKRTENRTLSHISRILLKGFDEKDYWYNPRNNMYYTTEKGSIFAIPKENKAPNLKIVKIYNRYGIQDTNTGILVLPAVYNFITISNFPNKLFECYYNGTPGKKDGDRIRLDKEELYEKGWYTKKSIKENPLQFFYILEKEDNTKLTDEEDNTKLTDKEFSKWLNINTKTIK